MYDCRHLYDCRPHLVDEKTRTRWPAPRALLGHIVLFPQHMASVGRGLAPEILCFRVQVASRFASPGRLWFETPPSGAPHHEDRFDRPHPEGAPKGRAIATAIARGVTLAFQVSARTVRLSSAR